MAQEIRFGTDGWRAVIGEDFTAENVARVVAGIAAYVASGDAGPQEGVAGAADAEGAEGVEGAAVVEGAEGAAGAGDSAAAGFPPPPRILIGYDTRRMSAQMARTAAQVCAAAGIEATYSVAPVPTPMVAEAVPRLGYSAGIVITASHNPPDFNGVKFKPWYGGSATSDITAAIESHIPDRAPAVPPPRELRGMVHRIDLLHGYLAYLGRHIDFDVVAGFQGTVVMDPMHGAAYGVAELVTRLSNIRTVTIHKAPRMRGRLQPEPIPPHTNNLALKVLEESSRRAGGAAIGFAFDGDGDRVGAVDEVGRFVSSHQIIALLVEHMAADLGKAGKVLKTVTTSALVDKVARYHGLEVETTPVGFKYLAAGILQGDVLVAGEESGGIHVGGTIPERDGILTALKVLEMLSRRGVGLSQAVALMEERHGAFRYRRIDLELPAEEAPALRKMVGEWRPADLLGVPVADLITIDGAKAVREDGSWLMLRPSGTEPVVRIYAEGHTQEEADALAEYGRRVVEGNAGLG